MNTKVSIAMGFTLPISTNFDHFLVVGKHGHLYDMLVGNGDEREGCKIEKKIKNK